MQKYSRSGPGMVHRSRSGSWALIAALTGLLSGGCASFAPSGEVSRTEPSGADAEPQAAAAKPALADPAPVAARPAATPALRPQAPLSYTVQPGDTLWGIANRFLLDPWQWPEVWYVNNQIANPHQIFPGDVLELIYVDGQPRLARQGEAAGYGVERLSPQVRELPLHSAIPTIPLEAIRDFLRGPRLVTSDELAASPYLLAFADEHLIGGSGVRVFIEDLEPSTSFNYAVVRRGQIYRDPDNGDLLGYEAIPVGEAEVRDFGAPSTAVLSRTFREALIGDRLLTAEAEAFSENFYPRAPDAEINGRIIAVTDGVAQIGQYYIVAMNRGTDHGLEPGHVLDILQAGRRARDPYSLRSVVLPESYAGQLIVFKVTPRVSYGLVMSVTEPVHVLDKVEKPVLGRR